MNSIFPLTDFKEGKPSANVVQDARDKTFFDSLRYVHATNHTEFAENTDNLPNEFFVLW